MCGRFSIQVYEITTTERYFTINTIEKYAVFEEITFENLNY